jgi:hypothetical protein
MLSLCYLPTAGRLTVTVIKGRNFQAMDITGSSGEYSLCNTEGSLRVLTVRPRHPILITGFCILLRVILIDKLTLETFIYYILYH